MRYQPWDEEKEINRKMQTKYSDVAFWFLPPNYTLRRNLILKISWKARNSIDVRGWPWFDIFFWWKKNKNFCAQRAHFLIIKRKLECFAESSIGCLVILWFYGTHTTHTCLISEFEFFCAVCRCCVYSWCLLEYLVKAIAINFLDIEL